MAAYAALVSLMNDLNLIPNHPTHSFSFEEKQITSLSQIVNFLIDFMDTYDSHGSSTAQILESRIASAAHAAHDVIESHIVDQLHAGATLAGKSRSFFLLDLQKATDNMDFIKRKAILFKATTGFKVDLPSNSSEPPTSEKHVTVGFDAVVVRLMAMLTGEPSSQRVIPIVGMGGMGKTTLARNVFQHLLIHEHFDVRIWTTISPKFSAQNILRELLSENSAAFITYSELGEKLHKLLWGIRYLIVLDDMWSVEAWDEIRIFFPDNENGSRVIVTTRLSNLAARLSSCPLEMHFLDGDQSWKLFCGEAFGEEGCPFELERIGKKIVKRCSGLPLSIVVIGGHLKRSSRAIRYWDMVANSINPLSGLGADDQCLKIVSLSYEHLPACLKPCFLYLGIFQEDRWIAASKILTFWIAEGFIKEEKDQSLEEVAEGYLKDLIDRNLILVRDSRWNGKVEFFVIHDVVRELCLKVAKREKFIGVLEVEGTTTNAIGCRDRRIVVPRELSSLQPHAVAALQLPSLVRSVMNQEVWFVDELSVGLKLLRLSGYVNRVFLEKNDRYLPAANFDQVNLRYLALHIHSGASIHSSMSLFWNIQILIINNDDVSVPYEIWEMTQLRHLQFLQSYFLPDSVPGVISSDQQPSDSDQQKRIVLKNLSTLLKVRNLRLTEDVCRRMPNIKNLSVSYYNVLGDCKPSSSYYCLHNLGCLDKLEALECEFGDDYKWRDVVLSFVLPTSLEELCLENCHWEDLTIMMKSLPRLGSLELQSIRGSVWDLAEVEFPRLKILDICECDDLMDWNANSSHFPALEILNILEAPKLSEIPSDIGEIPTLGSIHLYRCSVSAVVSAMRMVVEQESIGNEDLLLEVDFSEMEQVERFRTAVQEEHLATNSLHLSYRGDKI